MTALDLHMHLHILFPFGIDLTCTTLLLALSYHNLLSQLKSYRLVQNGTLQRYSILHAEGEKEKEIQAT